MLCSCHCSGDQPFLRCWLWASFLKNLTTFILTSQYLLWSLLQLGGSPILSILFLLFPFSHSLRLAWPSSWREPLTLPFTVCGFCGTLTHSTCERAPCMGDGTWGNRLGTLKIGMGRSQEPLDWLPSAVCQEREDFWLSSGAGDEPRSQAFRCPYIFAQWAGDLSLPSSAFGDLCRVKKPSRCLLTF